MIFGSFIEASVRFVGLAYRWFEQYVIRFEQVFVTHVTVVLTVITFLLIMVLLIIKHVKKLPKYV